MKLFQKWAWATLIAIYLVIVAGGFVRMTGSGMGCPDWPKCFGQWIPPTDISELPADYKEKYAHRGYDSLEFNVWHTWVEYANRLIGAVSGLLMLVLTFLSLKFWTRDKKLVLLTVATLLVLGFQGWLGATVVYSILAPFRITLHMLVALLIVAMLFGIIYRANGTPKFQVSSTVRWTGIFLLIGVLLQILLGTQVRQQVDEAIKAGLIRADWIESVNAAFEIHRTFSIALMAAGLWLAWQLKLKMKLNNLANLIFALLGTEAVLGIVMSYFNIPGWSQNAHLVIGSLLFGACWWAVLVVKGKG